MAAPHKLFLLDGMALVFRAYFAFASNPRITSKGLNTSAVFGFALALLDLLEKEKPTHIGVVFDTSEPTQRHIDYPAYKAQREAMPEDLAKALPFIDKMIEAFHIPVIKMPGYEADDVIGTLAWQAAAEGYEVYMVTPDKDFGQLVKDNVFIYKPARMGNGIEILGIPEILAKWEVERVEQVIDILGLWGDAVDNIPGIPGIGEKTAKKLIAEFGSIEKLVDSADQLKGKQKENVINFREQALLSKRLATIITDVPIDFDPKGLTLDSPNEAAIRELFLELEFRTLLRRVLGDGGSTAAPAPQSSSGQLDMFAAPPAAGASPAAAEPEAAPIVYRSMADTQATYVLVDTQAAMEELAALLEKQSEFCFDTEFTSLDPLTGELVGMSFSFATGTGYYVPTPADQARTAEIVALFKPVLEAKGIRKIGQNLKFDLQVMAMYGVQLGGELWDTMLAHYLIDPDTRHNMDALSETYLGYKPQSITELIGKKGKDQGTMREVDIQKASDYAAEDADITWQLKQTFAPILQQNQLEKLFHEVEMPLVPVLADMELEGVKIDEQVLADFSKELEKQIAAKEKEIHALAGMSFNIASPKQMGEVLFDVLKLDDKAKKTKTGQYKTDEEVLSALALKHPIAQTVLDYRQAQKLKSTYVDALPSMINPRTGRVHTSFNQAVAATGRLSSNNPNLQNIPIRTEQGREVRKAFVPRDENHILLSADYSQIELRIITEISGDENMLEAFVQGHDIHAATAAKVYNVPLEEVTSELRRNAKTVNFGIIYGISAFGLSQRLGIARGEAAELIEQYFKTYPKIREYMHDIVDTARSKGYVETLLGRRRYMRDINSANATVRGFAERNAINAPIQGTAADMIKLAMINIHRNMKAAGLRSKMTLQVHDELVFDAYLPELDVLRPLVEKGMKEALPMKVPVLVEMGTGDNWLEAH
ncbi:MAG: DNA polymerase I [Sphingobacteriaceae bacterium]|nr:DNA polymerase I [Sphingobacteriaceae bacterium]